MQGTMHDARTFPFVVGPHRWHHTTLVRALEIPFGFCGRLTPRYLPFVGGKQRIGEHAITTSEAWFTTVELLTVSRGKGVSSGLGEL
jgi:hypothetical protein